MDVYELMTFLTFIAACFGAGCKVGRIIERLKKDEHKNDRPMPKR